MREKPNSYLNQRIVTAEAQETPGVQTEILTQATVKISSDIAAFANPYSILTNEFSSPKFRAVEVSFVIDPAELAKNVVKLPTVSAEAKSETAKKPKEEKQRVKEKEYTIPELKSQKKKNNGLKKKNIQYRKSLKPILRQKLRK